MKYQNTGLCRGKPGGWSKRPSISLRWRTFSELSFYFQGSFTAWSLHPEGAQLGVPLTFNFWANLSPSAAPSTWAREGNFPTSHSPTPLKAWCTGSTSLGPCPKFQHSSGLEKPSGIAGLFGFLFVCLFLKSICLVISKPNVGLELRAWRSRFLCSSSRTRQVAPLWSVPFQYASLQSHHFLSSTVCLALNDEEPCLHDLI